MKIACDKCSKVIDIDIGFPDNWLRVKSDSLEFRLCPVCAEGFWQAVDDHYPPVIIQKETGEE